MTPQELARQDRYFHLTKQADLNPFSTAGARHLWQLGFTGQGLPWSVNPESIYANAYKRGQEAAKLQEQTA